MFLGSHVRALAVRLADKDTYTERHTRRVALRAVQVGEALGLSKSRLRTLAIGAFVHDIGKLSVPDAILSPSSAGSRPPCASSSATTTSASMAPATRMG